MRLVRHALPAFDARLSRVALLADRQVLAKTRWRGTAEDGAEFGFDLGHPLRHGEAIHQEGAKVYVVCQKPERLLEVNLAPPASAALVAWSVGNMHQPIQVRGQNLRFPDVPALRHLLEHAGLQPREVLDVFEPQQAAAGHHH